jgi:DNA-directed RNA polymerase specialized sigma24 family protein
MPDVAAACSLKETWDALIASAISRNVPFHDAEDLVSQSLTTALGSFDPARGEFPPYARTILINKIRNFRRDNGRRPEFPIEPGEEGIDPTSPLAIILHAERVAMNTQLIKTISASLTEEEAAFLVTLGETIEEIGDRAVSETARRLGLTELKGWDVFRRIQRKARKARTAEAERLREALAKTPGVAMKEPEPREEKAAKPRRPRRAPRTERESKMAPCMSMERREYLMFRPRISNEDRPVWQLAYASAVDKAYARFIGSLTGDQLARLETLAG